MVPAAQSMNARSTAASDWMDYAQDQRTVADPNTRQISKVSSAEKEQSKRDTEGRPSLIDKDEGNVKRRNRGKAAVQNTLLAKR
jgi:hypothetical protein